jgi:hypothetical protein
MLVRSYFTSPLALWLGIQGCHLGIVSTWNRVKRQHRSDPCLFLRVRSWAMRSPSPDQALLREHGVLAEMLAAAFPDRLFPKQPSTGVPLSVPLSQEAAVWALAAVAGSDAGFYFVTSAHVEVGWRRGWTVSSLATPPFFRAGPSHPLPPPLPFVLDRLIPCLS